MNQAKIRLTLTVSLLILLFPALCGATSLWVDKGTLFTDRKAHAVGDTITIIVSESMTALRSGDAANSKESSMSMSGTGDLDFLPGFGANSKDSFATKGSISNKNAVMARLTVQVVEIKPNGNLVLSGKQTIKQHGEEQRILINGTVRPEDVTADNTVLSTYVANAEINIEGSGPIARKQKQGVLTQLFNFLF
ncbi:flagellar basal body L-ring protein FlgH [Acetonema longum]|uniref:Flagellar L-ring protein n=1 Tax=Acetonema longum DSM 6540 TaxID=1009370 RepID=F7NIV2_9FIRM|nr:flagellar basal body L-ring protein FlgH [Acetonema longum]EGO64075.1 flagellar L-ring protein [Acetonema longum DSM 6540]